MYVNFKQYMKLFVMIVYRNHKLSLLKREIFKTIIYVKRLTMLRTAYRYNANITISTKIW